MRFRRFEELQAVLFFSVLRYIFSKKHLTIQTVHFIIYIIIVVLSADSKERRRQDEKANRKHPACPVYAAVPYANSGFCRGKPARVQL